LRDKPRVSWFEAISENYMGIEGGAGGRPLQILRRIRADYPVVLHGVSLSIGSTDDLNINYLQKLKRLIGESEPAWVSDHLCWTGVAGENLHDLMPLPYTEEALAHVAARVGRVQDFLGRRILLENVSAYLSFADSKMTEWEFLAELVRRSGCGILLDVNNVYVSSINQDFDPRDFIDGLPPDAVGQMHLAGHSRSGELLIDTHDAPVCDEVWELYRHALAVHGRVPTLIEWDDKIPEFDVLQAEAARAEALWGEP
jgi:uncharacterized protein (UPF0276 family)